MGVDFVLLANSATSNKVFDESGKAQPPEVPFKDRLCSEDSHVAREGGRMDGMEESRAV